MALDVGDARIGVALSDPLGMTAQPLCTLEQKGGKAVTDLIALLKTHDVGILVVGMPYELDGTSGEQAKKVDNFLSRLKKNLKTVPELEALQIKMLDERFTSQQAERALIGSKLKNRERSAAQDRIAAALILEGYLLTR